MSERGSMSEHKQIHPGLRFAYIIVGLWLALCCWQVLQWFDQFGVVLAACLLVLFGIPAVALLSIGLFAKSNRFIKRRK
jgi:hypothetical protein